jgi:murein biosynthesis integral membrane protein MurJ
MSAGHQRYTATGNLAASSAGIVQPPPSSPADVRARPGSQSSAAAAAGDSITVAAWTIVSRVTGVARFAVIGAVLGPTFFGNTYQFTNSLPNLVYYGFLAGSLFSSLLVPALVRHIDAGDRRASERVAGGFLGMTLLALVLVAPVAIGLGPLVLRFAALGAGPHLATSAQVRVGILLIVMFIPQIFCYGVVGTATAVMNSRQRFALAAGAPAIENIGTIAVLIATAVIYGTNTSVTDVPPGEMLLLGLGSTAAVVLHAATQWWGAQRVGVTLLPRPGWRDPEVRVVVKRALPSLAQAGLLALQVLTLLGLANRLPGGIVAFQIALNFYYLAIALGATPVALSLLPRLARMHLDGDVAGFRDALVRGFSLGFFVTIPAAVGYLVLAYPLARAVSFGRMSGADGVTMVAVSLAALSLAVVGQTAFMIATYGSYARKDTRSPLRSMVAQATVCLGLASIALFVHGLAVLLVLGLALSAAVTVAACDLTIRLWRDLSGHGAQRLAPSLAKFTAGAVIMAGPAWLTATAVPHLLGRPLGPRMGIIAGAVVGCAIYIGVQAILGTPELRLLAAGLGHARGKAADVVADAGHGDTILPPMTALRLGNERAPSVPVLSLDGAPLRRRPAGWLLVPSIVAALGVGAAAALQPTLMLIAFLVLGLAACVWARPALAAYLVITLTPLTVGISRGAALPLVRPNEAIALIVGGTLAVRGVARLRAGQSIRLRVDRVEVAMVLMAVANSVIPLLWMMVRAQPVSMDDLLYALVLWKLIGLYAIVRFSVTTERQVRRCLWLSVGAASVVAVLAILQSLGKFGVASMLAHYYSASQTGATGGLQNGRGSSTLGLPAATADLMILNLAVVVGLWTRYRRHRWALSVAGLLFVMGSLSAGEFSSAIGLLIGIICIAVVARQPKILLVFLPGAVAAAFALRSVIGRRLSGFQSASGLPTSWTGRLQNLQSYFWPRLVTDWNWVLGAEPAARIRVGTQLNGFVWIESGYTWLLWGGGIPLLCSYLFFVYATARRAWRTAHGDSAARSVAGIAVFATVFVVAVLMAFDPHLTYRGSADAFFFLLALAASQVRAGQAAKANYVAAPAVAAPAMEVEREYA